MKTSKYLLSICAILLLYGFVINVFSSISPEITSDVGFLSNEEIADFTFDYIPVQEIIITSNEDLVSFASEGTGTKENPYIIKDYQLNGQGVNIAIYITNVSKHFTIEHCRIVSTYGIVIQNLNGISINISNNLIAQFDTFYPVEMLTGIQITNCDNIIISQNSIESYFRGIDLNYVSNVFVSNNSIQGRDDLKVFGTKFSGIRLRLVINCTIFDNEFDKGGIDISSTYERIHTLIIDNNTVAGLKLGYIKNQTNLVVDNKEYGQIIIFDCNNITVQNQVMLKTFYGISCFYSSNCTFSKNQIKSSFAGILETHCYNSTITDNFFEENIYGIMLSYSLFSKIGNNRILNSSIHGIWSHYSTNITVDKNNITYTNYASGIYDSGSNNTYENNICNFNNFHGLYLYGVDNAKIIGNEFKHNGDSVLFAWTTNLEISSNSICFSQKNGGIEVINGVIGIIQNNLILENKGYGANLKTGTKHFVVSGNSFINNEIPYLGTSQAEDSGTNNFWYNPETKVGNYWSNKGIKRKYAIDGDANSFDLYPLKNPIVLPDEDYPLRTPISFILFLFSLFIVYEVWKKRR
ncbi:MAG: right-handed parallel beta-helix repeat-containing protein [Candidatus Heimdallarchaeota archaeon]|nr:right-handed parallel beta-helix repeat-containing protein [Candidatus Heimdallarchaeota archaeon]MCK5142764.1 right-handed parallel beta-helix repeat-containing protein [Candidatus Heimdallarchaeota archaeon]